MVGSNSFVLLVLTFSSSHCQLSITWRGATVTGPLLIYHNEVPTSASGTNALDCLSSGASWYFPNGTSVSFCQTYVDTLYQLRLPDNITRLLRDPFVENLTTSNGLWTCRLNFTILSVGIYHPEGEYGVITSNQVSLVSSSFMDNPPTFTLTGETRGGPPTMYSWTRDNDEIVNSSSFSISISLKDVPERFIESVYVSTLVVTGNLPGVYQYAVTNRAMSDASTQSIKIKGSGRVIDLAAIQVEITKILISWTAPSPAPSRGYRITTSQHSEDTNSTSHSLVITQLGNHLINVQSLSEHFLSAITSVQLTVRGVTSPIITVSLSVTSVNISWIQPEFSLPVREYTASLTRVTGSGQEMCPLMEDNRPAVTTTGNSMLFSGLEEFSTYTVTITAIYDVFNTTSMTSTSEEIKTLSAAPSGVPRNVVPSSTPTSIMVIWDPIDCSERNGIITSYNVVFRDLNGTGIPGEVTGQKFTAINLTPNTNFKFQVAGVNYVGTGPFADTIIINTGLSPQMAELSLETNLSISISAAVMFGALGFTVGIIARIICKKKRKKAITEASSAFESDVVEVKDPEANASPEYEEIHMCEIKPENINLKDNAAYGV